VQEVETDTRSGLNFLFVSGCFLTILAVRKREREGLGFRV
jgi:hypothetical protein